MRRYLPLLAFFNFLFLSFQGHAETQLKKVDFDYTQSGTTYQLVRAVLSDKILPLEAKLQRKIIFFTAREDLNGDETPEIIAKIADKKFFCDDETGCDMYIFAVSDKGPKKIAEFKADDVYISNKQHNNALKIHTKTDFKDEKTTLVWENGKYLPQNSEGRL